MFTTILGWIIAKGSAYLPYLIAILAALGGLFGIRQSGKNAAYADIAQKQATQTKEALDVTQANTNLSDSAIADKLREFYRD